MAPSSYILVGRKWATMQDVFYQNINLWITFRNFNVEEPNMSQIEEQLTRMDIKLPTPWYFGAPTHKTPGGGCCGTD